jgi:nucleotide-binding universal stress UspA family protein
MTTSTESNPTPPGTSGATVFQSVICGIDGSRASLEAARQAAVLAEPGGSLHLVAVTWEVGVGATAQPTLSRWRADRVLSEARDIARDLGVEPKVSEVSAENPAAHLLEQTAGADLVVVGMHGRSRGAGIALGDTASVVLHRASVPVLVARRPPDAPFPESILLAVDGTPSSLVAADVASRLAAGHAARIAIVSAPSHESATRDILAQAATRVREATGAEPVILDENAPPHRAVDAAAVAVGASLIVTGSRGLKGIRALHSVSERIAHTAPCSVLVVRGAS